MYLDGTKMATPFAIIFIDSLEEDTLKQSLLKCLIWWCYIDDISMTWKYVEEELQKFLESFNFYHPTIKFAAEYSKGK